MSKTNQVCITCTQRDSCQYYDPNRTLCAPVKVGDYGQFAGSLKQSTIDWQHYRIQAAIAAMKGQLANDESVKQMIKTLDCVSMPDKTKAYMNLVARSSVMLSDALIEELKKGGEQ